MTVSTMLPSLCENRSRQRVGSPRWRPAIVSAVSPVWTRIHDGGNARSPTATGVDATVALLVGVPDRGVVVPVVAGAVTVAGGRPVDALARMVGTVTVSAVSAAAIQWANPSNAPVDRSVSDAVERARRWVTVPGRRGVVPVGAVTARPMAVTILTIRTAHATHPTVSRARVSTVISSLEPS